MVPGGHIDDMGVLMMPGQGGEKSPPLFQMTVLLPDRMFVELSTASVLAMPHLKGVNLLMTTRTVRFFVLAILLGLLAGCQEGENANPFLKEKGVYSGPADEPLSEETNQRLRQRMIIQRGGSI